MSRPFRFKHFSVNDDRCGQKVGTDSIVLGSWASANSIATILDIGTGCGLLALMLAQRFPHAQVTAVEIDKPAWEQAEQNFRQSPWAEQLDAVNVDVRKFEPSDSFDLIVCNPPYFELSLKPNNDSRATARHDGQLTFSDLTEVVVQLLNQRGQFSAVLPFDRASEFIDVATDRSLNLTRRCDVLPTPASEPKRSLLSFGRQRSETVEFSELLLEESRHQYASGYVELAKDFLLKM